MRVAIFVLADIFIPLFVSLGREFSKSQNVSVDYFSVLPRDRQILQRVGIGPWPLEGGTGATQSPQSDEDYLALSEFMRLKHGGSDADWIARCKRIHQSVSGYLDERRPDVLLLWNGEDHVGRLLALEAQQRGTTVVYMENGYFPNTLQIDLVGVNASSSVAKNSFKEFLSLPSLGGCLTREAASEKSEYLLKEIPSLGLMRRLVNSVTKACYPGYFKIYPEERGEGFWKKRRQAQYWRGLPADNIDLPSEFVFIPLQVHDDTQVLLNCRHFTSTEPFIEAAYDAIRHAYGPDMAIVVKEHPVDVGRYDYGPLRSKYPDLIWLQKFDVDELIDRAISIFVINSSVGLQSIARHKPTVVFGEAFYAKPEIVFKVDDLHLLNDVASRAAEGLDEDMALRIDEFLAQLRSRLFVSGGWKSVDSSCVKNVRSRIEALLQAG